MALKLGLSLGALAAAQLLVGVALQFTVLVALGAGPATDVYVAAQTIPLLVFGILAMPLQSLWLPRLSVLAGDPAEWRRAQGLAQGQLLLLVGSVALLLAGTASLWIPLIFPGLGPAQTDLAVQITRIQLLAALLNGQVALLTVALRARDRFVVPELVQLLISLAAVVATFLIVRSHGVIGAAWVAATRSVLAAATLFILAERPRFSIIAAARQSLLWQQLRPLLAGSSVYKCEPLIDRFWGSQAPAGGLTILSLSQTGIGAVAQVLERSVCMPVVPSLARLAQAGDHAAMRALYRRCLWRITAVVGGFAVLLLLAAPFWDAAMHRVLKLPVETAHQMWLVCLSLLGFLHVSAAGAVPVAAFYALGDTRTPVRLSIAAFVVGIGLKSAGFVWLGLPGLALATSTYYVGNLIVVSLFLEGRLNDAANA